MYHVSTHCVDEQMITVHYHHHHHHHHHHDKRRAPRAVSVTVTVRHQIITENLRSSYSIFQLLAWAVLLNH